MRAAAALALTVAGCTAGPVTPAATLPGRCSEAQLETLLGGSYSAELVANAKGASGARDVRVVRPGQAVTMDYREDRLTITLDEQDRVTAARCG